MPSLDDYLFALDPAPDERLTASGLAGLLVEAQGFGTCGVTTPGAGLALPLPGLAAAGSWEPLGLCLLPLPLALAGEQGWHPGWGQGVLAALTGLGAGSTPSLAEAVLPPCFVLCGSGAAGAAGLLLDVVAGSGLGRTAEAAFRLSSLTARGHVCSLDSPASGAAASSDAVVALLGQGDPDLAEAVAGLVAADPDAAVAGLLSLVAGRMTYVADEDGDVWRCAPATLARGHGDCEDGAVLLHGLLLAAGLPADRIVTAFGRVGVDRDGHAWVAWRRVADGRWVALDWTLGSGQGAVAGLPVLGDPGPYVWVDYALTAGSFFTVRQEPGVFFARAVAEAAALPALVCAAGGSFGASGAVALPTVTEASGLGGAGGVPKLVGLHVAATGRYGFGAAAVAALAAEGLAGGAAGAVLPLLAVAALAGGGGLAGVRLPCPAGVGEALAAAVSCGACRLARPVCAGRGLAGGVGAALGAWPLMHLAGHGLAGRLGQGVALFPPPWSAGLGLAVSRGRAAAGLDGWRVAGFGRMAGDGGVVLRGNGEEWA